MAALTAPERRELGELMAAAYGNIPAADRRRLEAYTAGIRGGQISTAEQNREMSAIMRAAVLKLPESAARAPPGAVREGDPRRAVTAAVDHGFQDRWHRYRTPRSPQAPPATSDGSKRPKTSSLS